MKADKLLVCMDFTMKFRKNMEMLILGDILQMFLVRKYFNYFINIQKINMDNLIKENLNFFTENKILKKTRKWKNNI